MKILIADDSTVARLNAERTASKFGDIEMANDGQEALQKALDGLDKDTPFDVILLDLDMPNLDGKGFLQELRQQEQSEQVKQPAFVIIISAGLDKSQMIQLMQYECSDYIIKPYRDTELMEKLFEVQKHLRP
jgi:CheY-like chemotaxis protein